MADNHWYPRYVGDYAKDTAHLSLMEHGAFTMLLDWYYSTGRNLPANWVQMHRICKAVAPEEQEAVQSVVRQFFIECADGWKNDRADRELSKRAGISEKRRFAQAKREQIRLQNQVQTECKLGANAHTTTTTTTIKDISNDISIHANNKNPSKDEQNGKTKRPKADKGTRLDEWLKANGPANGSLPSDWVEWVDNKYQWNDATIGHIAGQFFRYFTGPDAKEPLKKDWKRAFQTWCDRSINEAKSFIRASVGPVEGQGKSYSGAVSNSSEQARNLMEAGPSDNDDAPEFHGKPVDGEATSLD